MWPFIALALGQAAMNYFQGRAQGNAAEQASEQQQQGVREARAYAEPLYANAQRIAAEQLAAGQAGLAPYAQQGAQGLTALTALLGLPPTAAAAPAGPGDKTKIPGTYPVTAGAPLGAAGWLGPQADATGLKPLSAVSSLAPLLNPKGPPAATQSSYVTLRAPTGQTQPVPLDQVDFYLARGATRI